MISLECIVYPISGYVEFITIYVIDNKEEEKNC